MKINLDHTSITVRNLERSIEFYRDILGMELLYIYEDDGPVAEGLMSGLEVFASEIPPFREIGTGYCHFFNLDSPASMADQIEEWFAEIESGRAIAEKKKFSWPDWRESTREFIQLVLDLTRQDKSGTSAKTEA